MDVIMNLKGQIRQDIKCSFYFPMELLIEQTKKQLSEIYGETALENLKYTCTGNSKGIYIDVVSKSSEDEEEVTIVQTTGKKRGRKPKNYVDVSTYTNPITFEEEKVKEDVEDSEQEQEVQEPEQEKEEDVDISNNKNVENPKIQNLLYTISSDTLDRPAPKELTPTQYIALRNKKKHSQLELMSILEYETDPARVYKTLFGDEEPKPVINPDAKKLSDEVSEEEKRYVRCFELKKKMEGLEVTVPKYTAKEINGEKVAFYRQVITKELNSNTTNIWLKYPDKPEMVLHPTTV